MLFICRKIQNNKLGKPKETNTKMMLWPSTGVTLGTALICRVQMLSVAKASPPRLVSKSRQGWGGQLSDTEQVAFQGFDLM